MDLTKAERLEYIARKSQQHHEGGHQMSEALTVPESPPPVLGDAAKKRRSERLHVLEGLIEDHVSKFKQQGTEHFWNIGNALREVEHQELWRETHPSFTKWLDERTQVSTGHAKKLIEFAGNFTLAQIASAPALSLNAFFEVDRAAKKAERKVDQDIVRQKAIEAAKEEPTKKGAAHAAKTAAHEALPISAKDTPLDDTSPKLTSAAPVSGDDKFSLSPRQVSYEGAGHAVDRTGKKLAKWKPGAIGRIPIGHDGRALCFSLREGGAFSWWWNHDRKAPKPQKSSAKIKRGKQ